MIMLDQILPMSLIIRRINNRKNGFIQFDIRLKINKMKKSGSN